MFLNIAHRILSMPVAFDADFHFIKLGTTIVMAGTDTECFERISLFLRAYSLPKVGTFR
jgi:hypothetical protein